MKTSKLLRVSLPILLSITGAACESHVASSSNVTHNIHTLKLNKSIQETDNSPTKGRIQEVINLDKEPSIFHYISNTDHTVVALLDKIDFVGKANKQEKLDLRNEVAGFVYTFRVEKNLCSKDSFSPKEEPHKNLLQDFKIFVRAGEQEVSYREGQRYLIFLRQIPKEAKLSSIYKLDEGKTYFQPFEGDKSIFPNEGEYLHSGPKKGIIEMSSLKHQALIKRVEALCSVLSEEDKNVKIKKLQDLTKSDDEELRNNAIYTIRILQN